jgi:hypothetical protein
MKGMTATADGQGAALLRTHRSSLVEKVLEYRFLAGVTAELLQRDAVFDVMRSDVDCHGHDLVIEANGIVRHVQLKAMAAGGKRADVTIHATLAAKASGCVVWMIYDPATFEPVSFRWFGGAPGEPMSDPGASIARHARANVEGIKAERPMHRVIKGSRFSELPDFATLVDALFGSMRDVSFDADMLARHLRSREPNSGTLSWLLRVRDSDFTAIPEGLDWDGSVELAHLVDGYALAEEAGLGDPMDYAERRLTCAQALGTWLGGPLELWITLFLEHRRWRFSNPYEPGTEMQALLDRLVRQLREALVAEVTKSTRRNAA